MSYLSFLIATPLILAFILSLFNDHKIVKTLGLLFSILIFLLTLTLWFIFDLRNLNFQFCETLQQTLFFNSSLKLDLGLDGLSLLFLILSTYLMPISIFANLKSIFHSVKIYFLLVLILTFALIGVFSCLNLLFFFIFFESVVPLMFIIIGVFGSRIEKVKAAHYFFIYTILGSVFMLLAIIEINQSFNTLNYSDLFIIDFEIQFQKVIWILFFLAFASKVPLVPFRIWLPLAHVEASITGSVLLAGVLLKLGTYGFFRFSISLFPEASLFFTPLIQTLSIISLFFAGLTTIRQSDLKRLIAYSSISRMAIVTLGLFSYNVYGILGSFVLMLARAFSSSGLFILVTLLYNRNGSRLVKYFRGLARKMPVFTISFLIFSLANISFPGTMNFIGEVLIFLGLFQNYKILTIIINSSVVLSAAYSLFLFNRIAFGLVSIYEVKINRDISRLEFLSILPLIISSIILGLTTNTLNILEVPVVKTLYLYI